MNLKYQPKLSPGYNKIVDSSSGLKFINEFGILLLDENSRFKDSSGNKEIGLVLLEGSCSIKVGKENWQLEPRKNLFKEKTGVIYIPPGFDFEISQGPAKIATCKVVASIESQPLYIKPEEVKSKMVGKDNWLREVRNILGPGAVSQSLIIGETINFSGNWSGTPPHKHDDLSSGNESVNEELYFFYFDKPQGWGMERIYTQDGSIDELLKIKNDTVTIMPQGFHQVVSAPGYNLYYLWILAGINNQLTPFEDPEHKWIKG